MRRSVKFRDKSVFYDLPDSVKDERDLKELDSLIELTFEHESQLYGRLANIAEAYLSGTDSRLKPLKTILNSILSAQIDELQKKIVETFVKVKEEKLPRKGCNEKQQEDCTQCVVLNCPFRHSNMT